MQFLQLLKHTHTTDYNMGDSMTNQGENIKKNPVYGRHRISRTMRRLAPLFVFPLALTKELIALFFCMAGKGRVGQAGLGRSGPGRAGQGRPDRAGLGQGVEVNSGKFR